MQEALRVLAFVFDECEDIHERQEVAVNEWEDERLDEYYLGLARCTVHNQILSAV